MEESAESTNMLSGGFIQNFLDNWVDIAIIIGALLVIVLIVSIVRRRLRRFFENKIPEDRMIMRKRTLTFNSVISNLIIVVAFIAAALIVAEQLGISVTPLLAGAPRTS